MLSAKKTEDRRPSGRAIMTEFYSACCRQRLADNFGDDARKRVGYRLAIKSRVS
jgi:hypothetical protein